MKMHAKARIQITVEIEAASPWGEECSIGQLHTQAANEAKAFLMGKLATVIPGARIIGEPKVIAVIMESV